MLLFHRHASQTNSTTEERDEDTGGRERNEEDMLTPPSTSSPAQNSGPVGGASGGSLVWTKTASSLVPSGSLYREVCLHSNRHLSKFVVNVCV